MRADHDPSLATLLRSGSAVGLTDGELLERFSRRDGEAAEFAFAVLVERHGPMVLRTCRAVLVDEHAALDAFQAVFLALARRGSSLWIGDSIAPWLHRVARHAAIRARRTADRRRKAEQGAPIPDRSGPARPDPELAAIVHEEVDRLPERHRAAIVLCDLEGKTHEEAARRLRCPVGTVKSRLARGRDRLRDRLARRGLAPEMAVFGPIRDALPAGLARSTVERAAALAMAPTAPFVSLGGLAMTLAVGLAIGATLWFQAPGDTGPEKPAEKPAPPASRPADLAWRRTDRYEPPDFDRFFPDDPEGGRQLDAIFGQDPEGSPDVPAKAEALSATEAARVVRQGLRRTTANREPIIRWLGQRFVWGASRQDPRAIEILYHASDHRGPLVHFVESPMIYFGLMRVEPKTPAIVHAMVDWCMHVENSMDWEWVSLAVRKDPAQAKAFLRPYLDSDDKMIRARAAVVAKFLDHDPGRHEANLAWARERARAKSGYLLPRIEKALRTGTSRERIDAMERAGRERLDLLMDESFAPAFRAAAGDESPFVRERTIEFLARFSGWDEGRPWNGVAADILLDLSRDRDREIRHTAIESGLTPLPPTRREATIRRLVEVAVEESHDGPADADFLNRIAWGLQDDRDAAAKILDEIARGPDPARSRAALAVYKTITGRTPPGAAPASPDDRKGYAKSFRDLYDHLGKVYPSFAIKGIDWPKVGRELLPRIEAVRTEEEFGLLVEELVARLEDSHAAVTDGTATPPAPPDPFQWDPWIASLIDDRGRPVLYAVTPGTSAWKAGLRNGMTVLSVNGVPAAEAMDRWLSHRRKYTGYSSERYLRYDAARFFHRQGERNAKLALEVETVDGRTMGVALKAEARVWYIPRLPVPRQGIEDGGADVQWVRLDDGIGYILVRRIREGLKTDLDQALNALGEIRGLILDVRGNSGGGFDTATAFRNFDLAPADGKAHRPLYRGPIALLIDERCISAGEGWASWFVARRRARLFGSTTAGASARKEEYTLTNGLYKVVVPVKAYTGFLDRPIERRGLEPDVSVRCTAPDLARGRDTVAEAALRWLKSPEAAKPPATAD